MCKDKVENKRIIDQYFVPTNFTTYFYQKILFSGFPKLKCIFYRILFRFYLRLAKYYGLQYKLYDFQVFKLCVNLCSYYTKWVTTSWTDCTFVHIQNTGSCSMVLSASLPLDIMMG